MEKPNQTLTLHNRYVEYWGEKKDKRGIVGAWDFRLGKFYFTCAKSLLLEFRSSSVEEFVAAIKKHIGVND